MYEYRMGAFQLVAKSFRNSRNCEGYRPKQSRENKPEDWIASPCGVAMTKRQFEMYPTVLRTCQKRITFAELKFKL
jgi:hypothetical protein